MSRQNNLLSNKGQCCVSKAIIILCRCKWDGGTCDNDIAPVLTDVGLCYTFNGFSNKTYQANKTGEGLIPTKFHSI